LNENEFSPLISSSKKSITLKLIYSSEVLNMSSVVMKMGNEYRVIDLTVRQIETKF